MIMDSDTMMLMVEEHRQELQRTMEWSRARPIRLGLGALARRARALAASLRSARLRTSNRTAS